MTEIADWRMPKKNIAGGAERKLGGKSTKKSFWEQVLINAGNSSLGSGGGSFGNVDALAADRAAKEALIAEQDALAAEGLLLDPLGDRLAKESIEGSSDSTFRYSEGPPGSSLFGPGGQTYNVPGFDYNSIPNSDVYLRGPVLEALAQGADLFTDPADRSGGGSGGGRAVPKYIAPDRRSVEEFVRDKLIVLTGSVQPEWQAIVDSYMAAARKSFEGASIDPKATVLEGIRNLSEYKRIHKLRQDFQNEDTWVGSRQKRLEQLGLSGADAQSRGVALATAGTNVGKIDTTAFQVSRGMSNVTILNRMKKTAEQVGRLL